MSPLDDAGTDLAGLPLSQALRHGSRAAHRDAEGSPFMTALVEGRVDAAAHAAHLRRLRCVYDALEQGTRARLDHPAVAAVHDPGLERLGAIDADLDHWSPGAPRTTSSPAARAWAARVREVVDDDPLLLVAHHYTRYLGDLSGGQVIGRVIGRSGGTGPGTAFHAFPGIERPGPWKTAYRARLDALDLPRPDVERVVAEVRLAFGHNRALLAELDDGLTARATVGA